MSFGQHSTVGGASHLNQIPVYDTAPGTSVVLVHVYAERNGTRLDRQAVLKLMNPVDGSAIFQTTDDNALGVFVNVVFGQYEVETSAVGYRSERKTIQVLNSTKTLDLEFILQRDPGAINLDVADTVLSPKARKDTKHAISLLKSGNLAQAEKHLDKAFQLSPLSPDLNFLMGYLYFEKKDYNQAGTYLATATNLNPHNGQALTLLGRTGLEQHDYPAARSALERAVIADAENWLPHSLLADAYFHQKDYDKAVNESELSIAKGKKAGKGVTGPAQLVLGQALAGLGRKEEALQALNTFLNDCPDHPMAPGVRHLIAQISESDFTPVPEQTSASTDSATAVGKIATGGPDKIAPAGVRLFGLDPVDAAPAPVLAYKAWQPPGVDDVKPTIAPSVECPSIEVVEESGKRVQELVADVARFAAVEDLSHQSLDNFGIPVRTEIRKYNYVASISEPQPGVIAVDEYRADKLTLAGYPDQISSSGFAVLALVFHPDMRDNFTLTCEGLGDWHGQASWLVHFQQREDRPSRMQSYKIGNLIHSVDLKGRAWITADKFQIVRIEAEMVKPMPEIQLLSEHQVVEYGPVPFAKKATTLWLPKSAEIYFDFRKHRYYRRHSFDHYMIYSVETQEKRKVPAAAERDDKSE